jgi:hypothetical protein
LAGRLGSQQMLELVLLLRVEQPGRGPDRPLLGHPDRVVGVEAVGRHRGGVDEPARAGRGRGPEGVQRALDVDRPEFLRGRGPGDQEGQVHHDVGPVEGVAQGLRVADVAAAVLHLRPAEPVRVERAPGDADDPRHPVVALEQGHQPEPERPGRSGYRDRQLPLIAHHPSLPDVVLGGEPRWNSVVVTFYRIYWGRCHNH